MTLSRKPTQCTAQISSLIHEELDIHDSERKLFGTDCVETNGRRI